MVSSLQNVVCVSREPREAAAIEQRLQVGDVFQVGQDLDDRVERAVETGPLHRQVPEPVAESTRVFMFLPLVGREEGFPDSRDKEGRPDQGAGCRGHLCRNPAGRSKRPRRSKGDGPGLRSGTAGAGGQGVLLRELVSVCDVVKKRRLQDVFHIGVVKRHQLISETDQRLVGPGGAVHLERVLDDAVRETPHCEPVDRRHVVG